MAILVKAQVTGGGVKTVEEVDTIQGLMEKLEIDTKYTATVNGEPVSNDHVLQENDYVTFAQAVKGGAL